MKRVKTCQGAASRFAHGHTITYIVNSEGRIEVDALWHERGETFICEARAYDTWKYAFMFVKAYCSEMPPDSRVQIKQDQRWHARACPVCRVALRLQGKTASALNDGRFCSEAA